VPTATLITGPRVALEPALAAAVARHQGDDPLRPVHVHVLVGETLLRPYLRRRLADLMDGNLGVKLVTAGVTASEIDVIDRHERLMPAPVTLRVC